MDSIYFQLFQALLMFAGVLGLIYLVRRYVERYGPQGVFHGGRGIELVTALSLGNNNRIAAVRFAEYVYLVAVAEGQMTLLDSFAPDDPSLSSLCTNDNRETGASFLADLRHYLGRHDGGQRQ